MHQRGFGRKAESEVHPDRFCPRCQLRFTAGNQRQADGHCALCAGDLQRGRLLTTADLMV